MFPVWIELEFTTFVELITFLVVAIALFLTIGVPCGTR